MILHEGKREGEAFKTEIDDKLKNTDEHDDDIEATKDIEIEIDYANDETEVNYEEKDKKKSNAKKNAKDNEFENDDSKDSTEVDNESENNQNDTNEVHTDESDEKTGKTTEPRRKLSMKTYLRIVILKKMILN